MCNSFKYALFGTARRGAKPGRLFLVGVTGRAAGTMKVIEILQSLIGKTGLVFTNLSQKLRCLNEQQEERSFD